MYASRITMKIRLHPCLKFRNEDEDMLSEGGSVLTRQFGNTDKAVNFTFEYQLKTVRELLNMNIKDSLDKMLKELPFQLEVSYTKLDGSERLRVISMVLPISHDKAELEDQSDARILASNAVQQSSKVARNGQIEKA